MSSSVSGPRLLTSAVAIHATACLVAFFAVGPRQADASYDFLKIDGHLRAIPEFDRTVEPTHARFQHIQKIAASDMVPSAAAAQGIVEWDEAKFDSQLEATSEIEDGVASDSSMHAEAVVAAPLVTTLVH